MLLLYLTAGVGSFSGGGVCFVFFLMPWSFDGNTFVWHKPVLCLTSVSVVTIVFAIAGERNDPALPALFFFFVMCSKTVKQQHASCIGQLHWRGKLLLTYLPPLLHIDATRLQFDCFSSQQQLLVHLSPSMKPVSVMTPALAPAVMFCFAFVLESPPPPHPYVHVSTP